MKISKIEIEIALLFGFLLGIINFVLVPVTNLVVPELYRLYGHAVVGALVSIMLGLKFGLLTNKSE